MHIKVKYAEINYISNLNKLIAETETDELCTILKKIGLGHYTKIFEENMVSFVRSSRGLANLDF